MPNPNINTINTGLGYPVTTPIYRSVGPSTPTALNPAYNNHNNFAVQKLPSNSGVEYDDK